MSHIEQDGTRKPGFLESAASAPEHGVSRSEQAAPAFAAFVDTIARLRAPGGCPWDQEQTHASIAKNMIEEAYEAVDTIEHNDVEHLREELGDVLLQVVLQSQIAQDAGEFAIDDVIADVDAKIVRRHPHVFGTADAGTASEVLDLWDQVKVAEQAAKDAGRAQATQVEQGAQQGRAAQAAPESLLDSVPTSFPALMQAQKISRKAVATGFEWDDVDQVWEKVAEEIAELKAAYAAAPKGANGKVEGSGPLQDAVELEFGDVLFTLVNVARKMGVDAETALRATCSKFRTRWSFMEGAAFGMGKRLEDCDMDEMQQLWDAAKALS